MLGPPIAAPVFLKCVDVMTLSAVWIVLVPQRGTRLLKTVVCDDATTLVDSTSVANGNAAIEVCDHDLVSRLQRYYQHGGVFL